MNPMKSMQVLEWTGTREMKIREQAVPEPCDGQLLIKVDSVGICGSELEAYLGVSPARKPPLVLGHELCGSVVDSRGCKKDWRVGAPVAVYPLLTCSSCKYCRSGNPQICPSRQLISMHIPGAYCGYLAIDESMAFDIPEQLLGPAGSLVEPLATGVQAVKKGCLDAKGNACVKNLVVVGAGPIGLLTTAYAASRGVERIVAMDLVDSRLDIARRCGATDLICTRGLEVAEVCDRVSDALGGLAESVVEAVGLEVTREISCLCVAPLGTIVLVGLHSTDSRMPVNHLIRNQVDVLNSYAMRFEDFQDAIDTLAAGVPADLDWLSIYPLSEGARAYAELVESPESICKVVLRPHMG
jgi:threonine dehydrogenase-like Zn-dependent dehydrogenase